MSSRCNSHLPLACLHMRSHALCLTRLSVCLIFSSSPVYSCILDIYDMYCFLSSDSRDAKSVKIKNNKATHSTKFKIRCSRVSLRKNQARGYRVHLSMVACCAQSCISVGGMVYCSMRSKIQMGGRAFLCFFWGGVRCRRRVVVCCVFHMITRDGLLVGAALHTYMVYFTVFFPSGCYLHMYASFLVATNRPLGNGTSVGVAYIKSKRNECPKSYDMYP